jgi:dTDP-glucose 4,6-dehydratase
VSEAFTPRTVLVTGGAGFIGSNFIRWLLQAEPSVSVVNLDLLTYAGNPESLADVKKQHGREGDGRYYFVHGDIRDATLVSCLLRGKCSAEAGRETPAPDAVVHMAAESHVDRSIVGPADFVSTNVVGTQVLLDAMRLELERAHRPMRFLHVSTDEVYGSLAPDDAPFTEDSPLAPNSPYAASKAASDCLVRAWVETFGLPAIITRCSNNYGPYQFPEKLIPLMITRAMAGESLPVYGDGLNVRDWLHVTDHAEALWSVLTRGSLEDGVYNIGGDSERTNLDVVRALLRQLGASESLIQFVTDRKGHDRRYAMNHDRLTSRTGWRPSRTFEDGLRETVDWYRANERWWKRVQNEAYRTAREMYLTPPPA